MKYKVTFKIEKTDFYLSITVETASEKGAENYARQSVIMFDGFDGIQDEIKQHSIELLCL